MCGIIGYVGQREAAPILIKGIRKMESRGYDACGIAVVPESGVLQRRRALGLVVNLTALLEERPVMGNTGIGHNRWTTVGENSLPNGHPHVDCTEKIAVVHNGTITNHHALRRELERRGHRFASQTDTEIIAHLIEDEMKDGHALPEAVRRAIRFLVGTFGIAVVHEDTPGMIVGARMGSPLVIGAGKGEMFLASADYAILAHTREMLRLEDGEMCVLHAEGYEVTTFENVQVTKSKELVTYSEEEAERGGHAHFMLKEIFDEPEALERVFAGRLDVAGGGAVLGAFREHEAMIRETDRVLILGCGTSLYAGMYGKLVIEELAGLPTDYELASEFATRKAALSPQTLVIGVSQSGETYDTLHALREVKRRGVPIFGIVNVVGSQIARECGMGIYTHAGREIGVASTKAYLTQLAALAMLGIGFGRMRGMSEHEGRELVQGLAGVPGMIRLMLADREWLESIEMLARELQLASTTFFLGRGYGVPTAFEAALKMKELAYVNAQAYPAGELKHGPLAIIDPRVTSILLHRNDSVGREMLAAREQILSRHGKVIGVGDVDARIPMPEVSHGFLAPLLDIIPLQLLAYHASVLRGLDPDHPRNLAKSVTTP